MTSRPDRAVAGTSRGGASPWGLAARETLLGPRGFSKMSHLWLPLALVLTADGGAARSDTGVLLALVVAVLCKTQFSILVNDYSDREDDRAVGKTRWIGLLPRGTAALAASLPAAAGLAAVLIGGGPPPAVAAYAATVLLGAAYSLRPFRFKERGLAGPLVYALSAAVVYVVVPWAWLGAPAGLMAAALAAVVADKWVQLHFHQVVDHAADLRRGVPTYAVRVGVKRARATLQRAALLASAAMVALAALVAAHAIAAPAHAAVLLALSLAVLVTARSHAARSCASGGARPASPAAELPWPYLGLAYLLFHALPPVLLALAAASAPRLWLPAALSALSLAAVSWQSLRYRHA